MIYTTIDCENVYDVITWCNAHFEDNWRFESCFPSKKYRFFLPSFEANAWFNLRWR